MTSSIAHHVPAARRIAGLAAAAAIAAGALAAGPAAAAGPEGGLHPNAIRVHPSFAYAGKATADAHFDYDVATYVAVSPRYAAYPYPYLYPGWWGYGPWLGVGFRFGPRYWGGYGFRHGRW